MPKSNITRHRVHVQNGTQMSHAKTHKATCVQRVKREPKLKLDQDNDSVIFRS